MAGPRTGAHFPVLSADDLEQAQTAYITTLGRPTKFNASLAAEIITRLEAGETLSKVAEAPGMPHRATINAWMALLPEFREGVARARSRSGAALADCAVDIVDQLQTDQAGLNLVQVRVGEVRAKVRLELAKAYDRDQYGDRRQVTGEITVAHTVGGIIDAVMGKTAPLVVLDAEEVPLIEQ
jgi:hypothetical protein